MQTIIQLKFSFRLDPHLPSNFLSSRENHNNCLRIHQHTRLFALKTLNLCSAAAPQSLGYGGWDEFELSDSESSGESNNFYTFLRSIGIGDKKYAYVYLFGFVCALAISRVRIPTIMVFPGSAILFALGFAVGFIRGDYFKELRSAENRKKIIEGQYWGLIDKLRNVRDDLKGFNAEVLSLKKGIEKSIERNQITVTDLEGYVYVIESVDESLGKTRGLVESYIQCGLGCNKGHEVVSEPDSGWRRKNSGDSLVNFSKHFDGFFGWKFGDSRAGKVESTFGKKLRDAEERKNRKPANMLATPFENENLNSASKGYFESKSATTLDDSIDNTIRVVDRAEIERSLDDMHVENDMTSRAELHDRSEKVVFDQINYNHRKRASKFSNSQQVNSNDYHDECETYMFSSQYDSSSSFDVSISMNRQEYRRNFYTQETFVPKKRPFVNQESTGDRALEPCQQSSVLGTDLEFNRYLDEADNLLKEAKECLKQQVDETIAEHALQKSALLLSKAIDMRPMSLLAVGQLGTTYLLHGELKLRTSRELRSALVRSDPFLDREWDNDSKKFEGRVNDRDEMILALVNVCEECEELLIKAGRKYKQAFSIDGNDARALYNWGLALTFRAQLIADIGPSAARDADKIFLAAIDKFDAVTSKSTVCAPHAFFRWAAALQHRSRLRPSRSREKAKLLQQARRLYEDALLIDSGNRPVREALSSCINELDDWYR